ncbi:MAG TPA: MFS transporter [Chloroflexia bacterium]|nr:MFS transporter [Chloroflexia bacterium]
MSSNTLTMGRKLGSGFRALRHRNYRLFFFGQLVSLIGTWMQSVAQGWLVLQLAGKNADLVLGLTSALQFAPVLLLSVLGGTLADRLPKRNMLVVTQSIMMVLALVLGVLNQTGVVQVWHVLVLAALLGATNAIDMPTRQAFVVEMVGKEDLMNSIALNSSVFNAARIVGPAVAGLLITLVGVTGCFYLNGLSFLAVIAGLLLMRSPFFTSAPGRVRPPGWGSEGGFLANLGGGFRYLRATPALLSLIVMVGAVGTFGMNFGVWMPVMARDVLQVGAGGYGLMMSGMGVGSLAAGLVLAYSAAPARRYLVVIAAAAFSVALLIFAASSWFPLSLLLLAGVGAAMVAFSATANTTVQMTVPDELRGRVMAIYMMVFAGTTPIGALLAGSLAHATSTPVSIAAGALVSLLAVTGTAWSMRQRQARPAPRPAVPGSGPARPVPTE